MTRGTSVRTAAVLVLAVGVFIVTMCPTSLGKTYVVDGNHPEAGDENPGTEQKPWATVQRAADVARAGDIVYVMEGDYPERVKVKQSGKPSAPVAFTGLPRHEAVVRGFELSDHSHVRIQGFKIVSDNPARRTPGIALGKGSHVEVIGNLIEGRYMGISGGADHVHLAFNRFYRTQFGFTCGSSGEHWLVERNEIRRQFQHRKADCDYSRMWGKDHLIRDNRFHDTRRSEIGKAHLDCVQSYNVKENNPDTFLHHLKFERNTCSSFSQAFMISTSTPGTHHHLTFWRNILYSGGAWGFCVSKIPHCVALNNTFADIKWYGFGNAGGKEGRAANNLFWKINVPYTTGPGFEGKGNLIHECSRDPKDAGAGEFFKGDPKFAAPSESNFRLTEGSAAIDAGVGKRDIGALAYPNRYVVDPRHPAADDEGFGYFGWPYATVSAGLAAAKPGETVILRGGTYRETITPRRENVTIRAADGEHALVSGADVVAGWEREENGTWHAVLAAKPARVLRDGKPWSGFDWDADARRIQVRGFDPRIHAVEIVTRKHGLDLRGQRVRVEGIVVEHTLSDPVTGAEKATVRLGTGR